MISLIRDTWRKLSRHQHMMVYLVVSGCAILAFYHSIWSPFTRHIHALRREIHHQQTLLAWLQAADHTIQQSKHATKLTIATPLALLDFLQKELARQHLVEHSKLKQTGDHMVNLLCTNIPFQQLITLLITTTQQTRVTISQFSSQATAISSIVNAEVNFSLPT